MLTGYVRNDPTSTWTADLTAIALDPTSTLPAGVTAVVAFTDPVPPEDLAPGDVATFTLTVSADDTVVRGCGRHHHRRAPTASRSTRSPPDRRRPSRSRSAR